MIKSYKIKKRYIHVKYLLNSQKDLFKSYFKPKFLKIEKDPIDNYRRFTYIVPLQHLEDSIYEIYNIAIRSNVKDVVVSLKTKYLEC